MRLRSAPVHHPQLAAALKQRPYSCLPLTSKLVLATSQQHVSPSSRWAREEYYTRELAGNHEEYLSGHGEVPGRWYGAGASGLGCGRSIGDQVRGRSRAAIPQPASCSAVLMAATPSPPSTWSCAPPRASPSSTASATQPPAGRCWPPIMGGRGGRLSGPPGGPAWPWRCPARVRPGLPSPEARAWRRGRRGERPPDCSGRWSDRGGRSCTTWRPREPGQHRLR